ncbi:hypothetical protein VDG1235_2491 [Verrucomicrobiia bacterium DG1235]|nr:hypothetical protein VDG1235_2491 [Verrucomicrobiae bacterium DG1235]
MLGLVALFVIVLLARKSMIKEMQKRDGEAEENEAGKSEMRGASGDSDEW